MNLSNEALEKTTDIMKDYLEFLKPQKFFQV